MRDKDERKQEILQAMGRIFIRQGMSAIGINSIAREAGCSKVLIYRYFTDLEGLYRAFAEELHILPFEELPQEDVSIVNQVVKILLGQLELLRGNPLLQEIMKFELVETNALTEVIANQREQSARVYAQKFHSRLPDFTGDLEAVTALLSAGITYLVLRSSTVNHFNGVPLQEEEGWHRIESAVHLVITLVFKHMSKEL